MGISFIDDAWDSLEDEVKRGASQVKSAFNSVWEQVAMPLLEALFNLLGFDGETVYSTAISTTKLVDDPDVNNMAATVLKAVLQNTNISEAIRNLILTGSVASAVRYYDYGKAEYIHGVPSVTKRFREIDTEALVAVISAEVGSPIELLTYATGEPSADIWAKVYLETTYGYIDSNKQIDITGTTWVYDYAIMDNLSGVTTIYVIRGVIVITTEVKYSSFVTVGGSTIEHIQHIMYVVTTSLITGQTQETTTELGNTTNVTHTVSPETGNFSVSFDDSVGFIGTGMLALPAEMRITTAFSEHITTNPVTETEVFPDFIPPPLLTPYYYVKYHLSNDLMDVRHWVYLIDAGTHPTLVGEQTTQEYPDLLAMPVAVLKEDFITVDAAHSNFDTTSRLLDQLGLSLQDLTTSLDDNADAGQIRDAFVTLSINLFTQTPAGLDYLFKFFMGLVYISTVTKASYEATTIPTTDVESGELIYPPEPVNTITITEGNYSVSLNYSYMLITEHVGTIGALNSCTSSYTHTTRDPVSGYLLDTFTIQWQHTTTTYKQIDIRGLFMVTVLRHTNGTTNMQVTAISDDPDIQKNFEVPLILPSLQVYEYHLADALVYEALTLQVFAADSVYLEYYETEDFIKFVAIVIQIVAVVVLVISLGTGSSISAALWAFAKALLIHFALTYTLEYVLKNTDNEAVQYLAMLLYVTASILLSPGSIDLTSVTTLLNIVAAVATATNIYISVEQDLLLDEMELFGITSQERQEEIDRVSDLLIMDNATIDYWDIMSTNKKYSGETPAEFYFRTGLRNPGVLVLDEISSFTSNKLRLPVYKPSID